MLHSFQTIYEDSDILVINKPAGLIVESQKKSDSTLEKILKKDCGTDLPRSGIVHRLDRDTSGLMIIAKNKKAQVDLQNQFASHKVKKAYSALVFGKLEPEEGTINIALKRDPKNRVRFIASKAKDAREAITHYEVIGYPKLQITNYNHECSGQTNNKCQTSNIKKKNEGIGTSFLKVKLETGRTHQIRAHFLAIGYPLIGDPVYKTRDSEIFSKGLKLNRQFLHAAELSFTHPGTKKVVDFKSDLPDNLGKIIK